MVTPPPYMLTRPSVAADPEAAAAFDALYDAALADGPGTAIDYTLPWPRWQFIAHVSDTRGVVVHGSQNMDITVFEPRKSNDAHPFGDRAAVFGSSDGLWSMYYAILDRATHPMLLLNAACRLEDEDGAMSEPLYFFSISAKALALRPYAPGMIYFLPGEGFEAMAPEMAGSTRVHIAQHASLSPVRPLARIAVAPEDFPFIEQMRGHDDDTVLRRIKADPAGFPWLDDGPAT
jgi:hypothetical protein